jgi:hypothetical protein
MRGVGHISFQLALWRYGRSEVKQDRKEAPKIMVKLLGETSIGSVRSRPPTTVQVVVGESEISRLDRVPCLQNTQNAKRYAKDNQLEFTLFLRRLSQSRLPLVRIWRGMAGSTMKVIAQDI